MRIAIVGGGFSGLLAAYLLEQKDHQVTVFEKEATLGGHCNTMHHKELYIELGTVFCLCDDIKILLDALQIPYSERFSYRNFIDSTYKSVEQVPRHLIKQLMQEIKTLSQLLAEFSTLQGQTTYGTIPKELQVSLQTFLLHYKLEALAEVLAPHLSAFGFGAIESLPAYYALTIFDPKTLNAFIKGEKLLFLDKGFSDLIRALSQEVSDIRYSAEVQKISPYVNSVTVETQYAQESFDRVLISTPLDPDVVEIPQVSNFMSKLITNDFITCAFKIMPENSVTTYFKGNLGENNKIQFYHTFKQGEKTVLVAYAYGQLSPSLVQSITQDIEKVGVRVKHLIAAKAWRMFPHFSLNAIETSCYDTIHQFTQSNPSVQLIGALVSKPAIGSLYKSIKKCVNDI